MKIKMLVHISGTRGGTGDTEWPRRGGEIEVPDGEGADLVTSGMAIEVPAETKPKPEQKAGPEPVVETATGGDSKAETAALTTDTGPAKRGPGRPRKVT